MAPSAAKADPVAALTLVLADALTALRALGEEDLACRLAARAWASLRHSHPVEARRFERLLHLLVRPMSGNQSTSSNHKES